MDWSNIHGWVEEFELWSTVTINATILGGAVPAAIAYARRMPQRRIEMMAYVGGGLAGIAFAIFAIVGIANRPAIDCSNLRTTTGGGAIIIGGCR